MKKQHTPTFGEFLQRKNKVSESVDIEYIADAIEPKQYTFRAEALIDVFNYFDNISGILSYTISEQDTLMVNGPNVTITTRITISELKRIADNTIDCHVIKRTLKQVPHIKNKVSESNIFLQNKLKIAIDTFKNPNKSILGGPSYLESMKILIANGYNYESLLELNKDLNLEEYLECEGKQ